MATKNAINSKATVCTSVASDSGTATPASEVLTISGGTNVTTSGTGSTITINASGEAAACAFRAYLSASAMDVTGNGTRYDIICNVEQFDVGSDYNATTGVFTAPSDGKYVLGGVFTGDNDASATEIEIFLNVNAGTYWRVFTGAWDNLVIPSTDYCALPFSLLLDLDSSDTVAFSVEESGGGGDTCDVWANDTTFYGYQII